MQEEEGGKQKHASTNQHVHITFLDANFEPLATQTLTTNQFGSCSGSFYIPPGILPGTYTLMAANKSVSIQVEEYKRPSFEVESNPLTGSYKLGDTLGLSGYAKAYSGSPVANGKVTYRVVRVPVIPYYRYNGIMPGSIVETETDRGITVTDELGNFDIEFIVTGDEFRKEINSFIYNIYIDVMDNAGESHSHIATISVGTEALYLDCQIPDYAAQGDTLQLQTLVKNRTGVIQKTDVLLTVYPIEGGTEFHRERYWSTPDLFVLDKSTYAELFPLDAYANEDNLNTRAYGQALQRYVFLPDGKLNIPTNNWKPGIYRLVCAAKDAANNEVSETFILTIREPGKSPWRSEYLHSTTQYLTAEPGSSIILNAAATRGKGNALFSVYRDNKEIYSRWLSLSDTYLQIPLYITEADRGGLTAKLVMIADNRIHELTYYLSVPWSNKNLQVIIEQLRDKTEPGKNESCTIRILDQNQKPTQAELMVTLYDKSLEAYLPHGWWFPSYPNQNTSVSWRGGNLFTWSAFQSAGKVHYFQPPQPNTVLTDLRWFQFYLEGNERGFYALGMPFGAQEEGDATTRMEKREDVSTSLIEGAASTQEVLPSVRQDFRETAFFYPHLETDSSGSITFTFQMPESLTSWQLIGMAHTSDGKSGITYTEMTTSKELMITPYLPRYFKTGDTVVVSARIVNRGKQPQAGYARLQLSENGTENALHKSFGMADQPLAFSLAGGEQTVVRWTLHVPENIHQVTCTFQVSTETFTDGEQHTIPILSNRIFITESLPLSLRAGKEETHVFSSLKENTSRSLEHVQLSIEMSSRPVWYAVQALPYLVEQPYDGSEQIFNRFYAHALATYMVSSEKRLKNVFEQWRQSAEGLVSPLEKEAAWKQIQLEETPWVQEAIDETTRLQRVGLLFDTNQMEMSLKTSWRQLAQRQLPNGGFGWFGGMKEDVVVTQYILAGIGRLYKMKAMPVAITGNSTLIDQALFFADQTFLEHHKKKLQHGTDQKETPPTYIEIQYLYARSYFMHVPMMEELSALMPFYQQQVLQHWVHFDLQSQAMAALYLLRSGNETGANAIVNSLKETAIQSEETGMYWKKNKAGFRWQEAPIETQALLVELFSESGLEQEVQELRIWLLNQKLTQSWESSKATADACYALLMEGDNWLTDEAQVEIRVGGLAIQPTVAEAGTGYFRSQIAGTEVKPGMALIETDTRNLPKGSMAWGSVYWQYTEEESRVLAAAGEEQAFNIKQEIYRKKQTPEGIQLEPLTENNVIKLGDKIVIRLVIEARRDADYVHVKSSRSAGIEPTDALSGYTWQDGIGYYQATRDAATHFFFDHLPKGKYVIEYEAFASHAGHFSAGLAEIQCLYAPLFSHHSRGIRLTVE